MPYTVTLAPAAQRELQAFPASVQDRLLRRITDLENDPRPPGAPWAMKKLAGKDELYRIRVGDYRVIYAIEDAALTVLVAKVADRKEAGTLWVRRGFR